MRPALQRPLGSPSALSVLRNAIESSDICQSCWTYERVSPRITKRPQSFRASTPSTQEREPVDVRIARDRNTVGRTGRNFKRFGHHPDQPNSHSSDSTRRSNDVGIRKALDEDVRTCRNLERSKKERRDGFRSLSIGPLQLQEDVNSHKTDHERGNLLSMAGPTAKSLPARSVIAPRTLKDNSSKLAQPTNGLFSRRIYQLASGIKAPAKEHLGSKITELSDDVSRRAMLSVTKKSRDLRRQRDSRKEGLESPEVPAITIHHTSQKVGQGQKLGGDCLQNLWNSPLSEERPSQCYVNHFPPPKAGGSGTDAALVSYHPGRSQGRVFKDGPIHMNRIVWHDSLNIEEDLCKVAWAESTSTQYSEADVGSPSLNEYTSVEPELALTQHAPDLHWKSMLKTQSQYEYESSVDLPASQGPRLIEYKKYASDSRLWLELVVYRRRHFGTQGLKALWEAVQAHNVEIPTEGANADYLWSNFVQMGLQHRMLASVINFAIRLQHKTKSHWKHLYSNVIRFNISRDQFRTHEWHSKLYERFPPTAEQFMSLFDLVHKPAGTSTSKMLKLQRIYKDLPFSNLYEDIITRLYKDEDFKAAVSWHDILIIKKDLPSSLHLYRPLFRYMVLYGDRKVLRYMVDRMVEARVPLPTFIKHPLPISLASQELIDQRLAEVHGIEPKRVGDEFCARLIATVWFSISTVIKLLCILDVDTLGSTSLRELVVRVDSDPKAVVTSINQLKAAGIVLGRTSYCSLVERLAVEGNDRLLENVIQCDLHPDTFDDKTLQERLLEEYSRNGDQLQIDRTLAILTAKSTGAHSDATIISNVLLRLQLKQKDIKAVNRSLELMYASRIMVNPKSSRSVASLFSHREVGKAPYFIYDVHVIANIWLQILRSGGVVPAIAWPEILRRLGMKGQLEEFEKLALWLAKYYSGAPGGPSLGMLPGSRNMSRSLMRRLISAPSQLDPAEKTHPLSVLFPPRTQQAIVAWGFQHSRPGYKDWRWGLRLLLKLKLFNVHILRSTVARACQLRLTSLFAPPRFHPYTTRRINQTRRAQNAHSLSYYIREMEKIGGPSLLFGTRKRTTQVERIRIMEKILKRTPWTSQLARQFRAAHRWKTARRQRPGDPTDRGIGMRRGGRRGPVIG